ncbi:unnamed protein product [Ectocarpus sp. 8 AP-2014]
MSLVVSLSRSLQFRGSFPIIFFFSFHADSFLCSLPSCPAQPLCSTHALAAIASSCFVGVCTRRHPVLSKIVKHIANVNAQYRDIMTSCTYKYCMHTWTYISFHAHIAHQPFVVSSSSCCMCMFIPAYKQAQRQQRSTAHQQ